MRTYTIRLMVSLIVYAILLVISLLLLREVGDSPWRILIAILPLLPIVFGVWAFLQYVRGLDELQRRIQLEAIAFSLACTGGVTFTLGLLENVDFPQLSLIWVFPMMIVFWGLGQFLANRRY